MRNHYCENINESLLNQSVTLCGWVNTTRDHGGVIFIDLRDHTGLLQVVFRPEEKSIFKQAETLRPEFVIQVTGIVSQRPSGTENKNLASGKVEIIVNHLNILNASQPLPFQLDDQHIKEATRLEYRFLDLRRPEIHQHFVKRSQICKAIRDYLEQADFLDIETPILTKATPEGARDYVVPSRNNPGHFYALPQSPQLFKQLLMMSGFDRYYQIVRCFRDEDLRADRQPEFTQLDIEMAFVQEKEVQALAEGLIRSLFKDILSIELPNPFPSMTYKQAMTEYGSDKPDLRIPLKLIPLDELFKNADFKVFQNLQMHLIVELQPLNFPKGPN
jgi:aspartyl-tRNA synthetase